MKFSVITPSFGNSEWLKLCVASVADQKVGLEHIIQDAGSVDGTLEWLASDHRVKLFVEKDRGMYDAVNRGLRRAKGDVLSYLNCDEQYLPGALEAVAAYFQEHPAVKVLFADFVAVDADGNYLFHRKVQKPLLHHTWVAHLQTFTCATFFRRSLLDEDGLFFNPELRCGGDGEWMVRLLQKGVSTGVLRRFTSTFGVTGGNLSSSPQAERERKALEKSAPLWAQKLKPLIILHHRLRRAAGGIYNQTPFSYELFTRESPDRRVTRHVAHPTSRWRVKTSM